MFAETTPLPLLLPTLLEIGGITTRSMIADDGSAFVCDPVVDGDESRCEGAIVVDVPDDEAMLLPVGPLLIELGCAAFGCTCCTCCIGNEVFDLRILPTVTTDVVWPPCPTAGGPDCCRT